MQEVRSTLVPGTLVHARGERWHVRDARNLTHGAFVVLDAAEAANPRQTLTLLLPFDGLEAIAARSPARRRRHVVLRRALRALSEARPEQGLWTARGARMDLLPWQLEPALDVLRGATRLLLADAVGLGKTIQAGLILAELRARGVVERALILSPPALRRDWAVELNQRFDVPAAVLDPAAIVDLERTRGVGMNPWAGAPVVISSIDLVKRADVLRAVERAPVDLLIVDEVHHATPGTDRFAAISRLARQAPWVILASATPHSGDAAAYRALTTLGELGPPPVDSLRVYRRSHDDVRLGVVRRTHTLRVTPTLTEQRLHDGVLAYARDLCQSPAGAANGVQLLAGVLARRATSSPLAIERTLRRRLDRLNGAASAPEPAPLPLPWEELDEDAGESWLSLAGLADRTVERQRVDALIALAEAAGHGWSKGERLRRLASAAAEPMIVFTEFRDSLDACRAALGPAASVVCLHGEVDARERRARIDLFLEGRARVLLATDVAGEGLNLQEASRLVVTLEWPWNPLRIEQRVGRVHRLGQARAVHAIHLTAARSYEDVVVARALSRAARAVTDLGEAAGAIETVVAAEVLGSQAMTSSAESVAPPGGMDQPGLREAERLGRLRHWARLGQPVSGPGLVWAWPRRGPATSRLAAVVEVRRAAGGSLRSCEVVPIEVTLRTAPSDRREWRNVCRRIAADSRVHQAAVDAASGTDPTDPWIAARERMAAIVEARRVHVPTSVQPSLFDRRAWRDARELESAAVEWEAWRSSVERRLAASGPWRVTTRIVALLPLGRTPQ
jgi:superfamily II DNA or RNA helicase